MTQAGGKTLPATALAQQVKLRLMNPALTSDDHAATPCTAIDWLRAETRAAHDDLERSLHVARPGAGRTEFLSYLRALHAWQASFEDRLWSAHWPAALQVVARRGKCAWMQADLGLCSVTPLAPARWQPPLHTQAQRVGLAYVVEGAQLGTRVLAQRLAPALEGWQPRFLQGYGQQTGALWKSFLGEIEILLDSTAARREAGLAARQAFESLACWFERCHAASPKTHTAELT